MKIKEMKSILTTNKFDNCECNFKLKTGKPKVTLESLSHTVESLSHTVESLAKTLQDVMKEIVNIKQDIKYINSRIDKLEELVVDQFKEHGWIN